jgi:cell division protein FtsL
MIKSAATTIQLTTSANGKRMKTFQEKVQTAIISIATTGIISCAGFLWKANASLSQIEEHLQEIDKRMDNHEIKTDNLQLDVRDIRERVIRVETLQKR